MSSTDDVLSLGDILKDHKVGEPDKYISREFQQYGYDLAMELGEPDRVPMFIKIAKQTPRWMLDDARGYVKDYPNAKSKGKLFMWKLSQIKKDFKGKGVKVKA